MLAGLRSDARFEIDLGGGPPPGHRQGPSGINAEGKKNLLNKIICRWEAGENEK